MGVLALLYMYVYYMCLFITHVYLLHMYVYYMCLFITHVYLL